MRKSTTTPTTTREPPPTTTTLVTRITELVHACFTGLYIETREPEEAVRDLTQLARRESWRLGIWDCDAGLTFPCENTPPASPTDTNDPLAVLRSAGQLSQGAATTVLVLQNFHRFLGSTEILQAVQKQVSAGKHTRTFVVILAPVVNLPPEIEKALAGASSSGQTDSGVTARVFGSLLTWLNDHEERRVLRRHVQRRQQAAAGVRPG